MSFSEAELQQHCQTIIQSRRIKNKIVILCEGGDKQVLQGRPSPSTYGQLERLPDANFYMACIPHWWQGGRPEFFVCGDREGVINTYFALQKMHETDRNDSYLNINRLFAIIDLDLQIRQFENYPISDTETLFKMLYQKNKPQLEHIEKIRIFITGLIYKEAYFLIPDLQTLFDNYPARILFDNTLLNLINLYQTMASSLFADGNLNANFQRACDRINYLEVLDFSSLTALQDSWLRAFDIANEIEKQQLIYALLTIHQVKPYWKKLKPADNSIPQQRFEEQLTLAIGQFYAKQSRESQHHLPSFFNMLSANHL